MDARKRTWAIDLMPLALLLRYCLKAASQRDESGEQLSRCRPIVICKRTSGRSCNADTNSGDFRNWM
jgi:hypothetical protein